MARSKAKPKSSEQKQFIPLAEWETKLAKIGALLARGRMRQKMGSELLRESEKCYKQVNTLSDELQKLTPIA